MIKVVPFFSIFCGVGMLITWAILLLRGEVPDLRTDPIRATLLLAAEFLTAGALIAGGYGMLTQRPWALRTLLIALGMLLYCTIYSVGVFGQQDNVPATAFFVVVSVLTLVFSGLFILQAAQGDVL